MDQPAGLQVDYIFRGVEHAVRVVVSGQVLELEVEDRMTADQWRGEFDASCECACWGGLPSPLQVSFFLKLRLSPVVLLPLLKLSKVGKECDPIELARDNEGWAELEKLSILPLGWVGGQISGGTFLPTQSLKI